MIMTVDNEFLTILNDCLAAIKKYSDLNTYPQYSMYKDRYDRMLRYTEDLLSAVNKGALAKDFWSLEITKMLDMNDPEELKNSVLGANKFYCKHYQKL